MKTKLESQNINSILDFLEEITALEKLPRTGLMLRGVTPCENVAAHVFETAVLAMLIGDSIDEQIDMEKLLRMVLLHELAEARITDIPFRTMKYLSFETKSKMEKEAFKDMCESLPNSDKYNDLFNEFENTSSIESKIARAADKLQMMLKVYICEKEGNRNLDVYWENNINFKDFDFELVNQIFDALKKRRNSIINKK